ncbi:MAG: hypothetical protein JSV27_00920 [Candidatus Bathyarchaeota archaeon]|nr:MAG: hypothetical protein JSV27_00920 [Candidatus Bathyarchaeota archaeon]
MPALFLNLDKFQWNIDKMFGFAKEADVNVTPHAKTVRPRRSATGSSSLSPSSSGRVLRALAKAGDP